jgi:acetyl esterase
VVEDLDQVDSVCRLLCNASAAMVASVDYHLAPENPFPIPAEEAYRVLQWAATEAGPWGGDGARIAVAGDSAGGNLALAATLMSIDRQTPRVSAQALIYPVCAYQFDTPSYLQWGTGHGLTRDAMQWYSSHYLTRPDDARNPYAAPLARQDLSGLPPTVLITAEYDPLRDEGEAMAERLWSSGVTTTAQRFLGMVHGFFSGEWAPQHRRQAVDAVASHLLHGWA